jgi:GxxExxY protein
MALRYFQVSGNNCNAMDAAKDQRTYSIIGAAMEVHRELGHGFLESVYQEAFALELEQRGIPYKREAELPVQYKGRPLKCTYRPDFLCHGCIVVELKALAAVGNIEMSQVLNYLKAGGFHIGLLINFGAPSLQYRRYINHPQITQISPD